MQPRSSRPFALIYFSTVIILCLLTCLIASTKVQAQKTPSIFKSEGGDKSKSTSANNLTYLNDLESQYRNATDKEEKKRIRNELVFIGVEQVDTVFNDFRKKSRTRNDTLQFLFDFLEIGASSAISIVKGERPKSLIGEALSLFQGSRSSFNKHYRLLELQTLFNKMVANRSKKLLQIYDNLNQDAVQYPWEKARSELKEYFFAGTIDDALNTLSIDTGAEAKPLQERAERAKRLGIRGAPTQKELKNLQDNLKKIAAILTAHENATESLKTETDTTKKQALQKKQQDILKDYRNIYDQIDATSELRTVLESLPDEYAGDPEVKARLEKILSDLKAKRDVSADDYDFFLTKFSGAVSGKNLNDLFAKVLANFNY